MIDAALLADLIKSKKDIDFHGENLQKQATNWANDLKEVVGPEVFGPKGIDWAEICLKICKQHLTVHAKDYSDRTVENDR